MHPRLVERPRDLNMNSMTPMSMELQLQLHQQMLLRQQQIVLRRHRPEDLPNPNGWTITSPGAGPLLPPEVQVQLQNRELWQQFHAETTEMIITKSGRRMFPSIQLSINGLDRRARYYVLLEVAPVSDRRHKYVGNGSADGPSSEKARWTSAGPAEPQPRIDRRLYLHPDSPATGAHWMQHPINFTKLKLTNNAVDHRNNVVLTSMHKYVPRIWIIRCDEVVALTDLYSHPASSFSFNETEFIAVTAYQNENITKLKINNNPFAKGFRESGQSRCKRKFQQTQADDSVNIDDEEGNTSESESKASNDDSSYNQHRVQRAKPASSDPGSLDDNSRAVANSPTLAQNSHNLFKIEEREPQPRLHRPWIDSPVRYSSSVTDTFSRIGHLHALNLPNYLRLLPPELVRLRYQTLPQFSMFY